MPIEKLGNLKQRELKTRKRLNNYKKSADVLCEFFDKGFTSFDAIKAIVKNYNSNIDEASLWDFWHFRNCDEEIISVLQLVLTKLK